MVVKSEFSRKIRKEKRVPCRMRVKGEEYEIDEWAQCDRCQLWRKVKEDYGSCRFYCRLAGKQCKKQERYEEDMILL
jgi:hypothetical protein